MLSTKTLEDERAIGFNLYRIMKEKEITEEQLSNLLHIPEIRIRAIVTGSIDIQEEELDLFASGLDVDKEELLQSVSDEDLYHHNIHYMGTIACKKNTKPVVDKVDMYVRLLNLQSES